MAFDAHNQKLKELWGESMYRQAEAKEVIRALLAEIVPGWGPTLVGCQQVWRAELANDINRAQRWLESVDSTHFYGRVRPVHYYRWKVGDGILVLDEDRGAWAIGDCGWELKGEEFMRVAKAATESLGREGLEDWLEMRFECSGDCLKHSNPDEWDAYAIGLGVYYE